MNKVFLIRHAQPSLQEYSNLYPGPSLGELGIQQANWVAEKLEKLEIQQIFASSYPRVLETLKPFSKANPSIEVTTFGELWEREPTVESHESLVERVHLWLDEYMPKMETKPTAIFGHCGPINMILEYLDPDQSQLDYTFTSPHGCHTPCAGIWKLKFHGKSVAGTLTQFSHP